MRAARTLRVALLALTLEAGAAGAQGVENDERRLPYEQLPRRQNEIQLGVSSVDSERSVTREVRKETMLAFVGLSRGFTDRIELGVFLPYVVDSVQTTVSANGRTVLEEQRSGASDPTFRFRYRAMREEAPYAVTLGAVYQPDWGGRERAFNASVDTLEPFVVLGERLGAGRAYFRYGYIYRSGGSPETHRLTLGGRHPVRDGLGVLGHVSYLRAATGAGQGRFAAGFGGYVDLSSRTQLLAWVGGTDFSGTNASGQNEEASARQTILSIAHRF